MSEIPFSSPQAPIDDEVHLAWLDRHRAWLLDFYQPAVSDPDGGFGWLDSDGRRLPQQGRQLWIGARMLHVFSVAAMLGRDGADEQVRHGLEFYLHGAGRDAEFGGWFATVGGQDPSDRKELYGHAQLLLGASSALLAGFDGAGELLADVAAVIDRHYWVEDEGRCRESFDRAFTEADPYRGQNANMHLTEAYMAAHEATGEAVFLERAVRIATFVTGRAASGEEGAWRLPEHFDSSWQPQWDYNVDNPRHPFRPFGSQPGHWLEWAKLLVQLQGLGVDEPWLLEAAVNLFDGAVRDAQQPSGGFIYTVDWDGRPVVTERFFWEVAEGIGAARYLALATGDQRYHRSYQQLWRYCVDHLVDRERGSWHSELDAQDRPVALTWEGKPDLYHAFQATLYALLPADRGIGRWAADRSRA